MSTPTPEAQAALAHAESTTEAGAYDALADLFLGDKPVPAAAPAAARNGQRPEGKLATIELMMLGHLPVTASAWVMQYARQAATDAGGPVAMLWLRGGEVSIEIVGEPNRAEQETVPHLPTAIAAANQLVKRWLVRVDDIAEPLAAQVPGLDSITLLTGADEAAVVSAYQMIKNLGAGGPDVKLAIMGAAPERALESAERIARTASAHLSRNITVTASVSRIAGGRSTLLHLGPQIGDEVDALNTIVDQVRNRKAAPSAPSTPAPASTPPPAQHAPQPVQAQPRPAPVQPVAQPAAPVVVARPRPAEAPALAAADGASGIAALVTHLGLEVLPFACPAVPAAKLAVDREGRLNIVVSAGQDPVCAAGSLAVASVWTRQNGELLRLASASCGKAMTGADSPELRIVTDQPKHVKPLLDGDIRLHLVAQMGQAWFVTDLN